MKLPIPKAIQAIANSEDRMLAWHFFIFFSRFEYALKRSGQYLKNGDAQPNWDKFASDHESRFNQRASPEVLGAVDYFLHSPPRKQLARDGALGWSEPQEYNGVGPRLCWLLRAIRYVRNNLFHGGKFPLIPISDPSRDRDLLLHAMVVLQACLPLNEDVHRWFNDAIAD
jgi:hypothetical protein